jgi:hypothetical protein
MVPRSSRALAVLVGALIVGGSLTAAPALAATSPAITDCVAHGALTKTYSVGELHHALTTMSAPTREYTNCLDVLNRALAAAISKPGGDSTGSSGSGSFLPVPVIIILAVLVVAAITFAVLAVRRRGSADRGGDRTDGPAP